MNPFLTLSCLIVFLIVYFIMAQFFAHRRFNYLQETSIAIITGVVTGVIINFTTDFFSDNQANSQNFIRDMIFLILLPPIMFEDGYNFPKRKFFQNFSYINLFGILGTAFNFAIIWGILYGINKANLFVSVSDASEAIVLYNWQILLVAAALSSIEPVVTEKVVDKQRYPKLFSIIFGESLFKDTLSVTFFDSIRQMVENSNQINYDIQGQEFGYLFLRFLMVVICSILIGVVMGLLVTIVFKNWRFLVKEVGISQMALTIMAGFLTYVLSEWATLSGVISMLFCGTVLAHYNAYNLTEEGKSITLVAIEVLKIAASGVIFFFIGFEIFDVQSFESAVDGEQKSSFSASFLAFTFLALLIGRVANVFLVSVLGWACTKRQNWRLNVYECFIIFLGGLVHGAVPFALSVTIPFDVASSNCAQLNIILVVLITSLFFNIFIPKVQKFLLGKIREMERNDREHPSVKESFGDLVKFQSHLTVEDLAAQAKKPLLNKFKSRTQKYWRKFEEGVLKPFLIFDYHERRQHIKMEKVRQRIEEHKRYLDRYAEKENLLDAENEEDNTFIEVKHSENSGSSEEEESVMKIKVEREARPKKAKKEKKDKKDKDKKDKEKKDKEKAKAKYSSDEKSQHKSASPFKYRVSENLQSKSNFGSGSSGRGGVRRPSETEIVSLSSQKKKKGNLSEEIELKIEETSNKQLKEQEKGKGSDEV